MDSKVVVGRIEPMVFDSGRLSGALSAISQCAPQTAAPAEVTRSEAEAMANAAQRVWDLVRTSDPRRLDRIEEMDPEFGAALLAIRAAMR